LSNEIGWENVSIVLIEAYPCDNKMEMERRERYWIELLKPSLNTVIPTRTREEYNHANRDKIRASRKNYRDANRDTLCERNRERYAEKQEKSKAWCATNQDKLLAWHLEWVAQNTDRIDEDDDLS
jgi:hypothetical protein